MNESRSISDNTAWISLTGDVTLCPRGNPASWTWQTHRVDFAACLYWSLQLQKGNVIFQIPHAKLFVFEQLFQAEGLLNWRWSSPTMGSYQSSWRNSIKANFLNQNRKGICTCYSVIHGKSTNTSVKFVKKLSSEVYVWNSGWLLINLKAHAYSDLPIARPRFMNGN